MHSDGPFISRYRLAVYFKTPPEYRMNLEASYDLELVTHSRRGKAIAEIKPRKAGGSPDPSRCFGWWS